MPRRLGSVESNSRSRTVAVSVSIDLARGGFDPKEHQFVRQLVNAYPKFRNAYTKLVLISTDNQLNINEFRDALGATWPFLSDPDRVVQKDLDIKEFKMSHTIR